MRSLDYRRNSGQVPRIYLCGRDIKLEIDENAKKYYLSLLEEALDNPNQIISSYYAMDLWEVDSLEKRKVEINKVTREDVINFSKKIYIDTVFLLGGDNSD